MPGADVERYCRKCRFKLAAALVLFGRCQGFCARCEKCRGRVGYRGSCSISILELNERALEPDLHGQLLALLKELSRRR